MKWDRSHRSGNVDDRRGEARPRGRAGGIPLGGKIGGPGALVILVIVLLTRSCGGGEGGGSGAGALDDILNQVLTGGGQAVSGSPPPDSPGVGADVDEFEAFMGFVLDNVEGVWQQHFDEAGQTYTRTRLQVYTEAVETGCGLGQAQAGPFYCPAPNDNQVYIDPTFMQQLSVELGAPGDFAQAYVLAHEVGHHVQNLLGVDDEVRAQSASDASRANDLSVRQELQADCFAGIWAYAAYEQALLEPGDIDEALQAASAVGDDTLQGQAGLDINPESFTHGSAEQRKRWFDTGFQSGDPQSCDTFAATDL